MSDWVCRLQSPHLFHALCGLWNMLLLAIYFLVVGQITRIDLAEVMFKITGHCQVKTFSLWVIMPLTFMIFLMKCHSRPCQNIWSMALGMGKSSQKGYRTIRVSFNFTQGVVFQRTHSQNCLLGYWLYCKHGFIKV